MLRRFCGVKVAQSSYMSARALQSIAIEQATRLVHPTPEHPATGDPVKDPTNPRVVWREHWSLAYRKPFYHNLMTNEVSWDLPKGFPSRFDNYWRQLATENPKEAERQGVIIKDVSEATGTLAAAKLSTEGAPEVTITRKLTMKEQIMQYGHIGFILYGIIHFGMLFCVWMAIYMGLDLGSVARKLGFNVDTEKKQSLMATLVVAIAVNKIFVPVQIASTLYFAPRVAPYMRQLYRIIMT